MFGVVMCETPKAFEDHQVAVGRAAGGVDAFKLADGNHRQRPEVSLSRALKIALVVKLLDGLLRRITVGEVVRERQLADTGIDG